MAFVMTALSWGLLSYREGYEAAGQVAHAEVAIKWTVDYFLKCHSESSTLWGQVGDGYLDHAWWGRPEEMPMERPSWKIDTTAPGSELAGETAAGFAAASLVFRESDPALADDLVRRARELFDFADQYRAMYHESIPNAVDFYKSWSGYGDDLVWSACWLYKVTGEQFYADKAKDLWAEFNTAARGTEGFGSDNKNAGDQVLFVELFGDEEYVEVLTETLRAFRNMPHTPGGMLYLSQWGSLVGATHTAFIALKAADLGIEPEVNRAWAEQQINYALGSSGRSYLIGYGDNYPLRPHHRGSSCLDLPEVCDDGWALNQPGPNPQVLYGALVGGPDMSDGYTDERSDYVHNEVSVGGNTGFTSALAALTSLRQA
ncbi:endoglucanase E-4 [Hyalella azteca]|uniref:Endoglucanase n=1 Tax=Hyalella azteca TaxID=294128 RepID=A0A8B7P113_HYAAZ|nr:endoglucanase E-4 [Hyalella azteca]